MPTWTFEQGIGSAGTEPLAYSNDVKAGSLLVVMGGGSPASKDPAVPTDTRGTTYTRIRRLADVSSNDEQDTWWWGIAPSAGPNTVNFDAATSFRVYIVSEFSVDTGTISIEDETGQVQASNTNADNNVTSGSITTLGTDRLIVGFCVNNGTGTSLTAGTNFTERVATTIEGTGGGNPAKLQSRVLAAAGSVAGTWTAGSNMAGANVAVAAFKAEAVGAQNQLAWIKA